MAPRGRRLARGARGGRCSNTRSNALSTSRHQESFGSQSEVSPTGLSGGTPSIGSYDTPTSHADTTNHAIPSTDDTTTPASSSSRPDGWPWGKFVCYPIGKDNNDRWLEGGQNIPFLVRKMMEKNIVAEGTNLKAVPKDKKDVYCQEFVKQFTWDSTMYEETTIKEGWLNIAINRYKDLVSKTKTKCEHDDEGNLEWLFQDVLNAWQGYWSRPDIRAKSEQASKNRRSEVAGLGTGMTKHEKETGRPASAYDTFLKAHMKADGTFPNEKSNKIVDAVDARIQEAKGVGDDDIDATSIYVDVVGVNSKKQRLFGVGSMASEYSDLRAVSVYSTGTSIQQCEQLLTQLDYLKRQLDNERAVRADLESKV